MSSKRSIDKQAHAVAIAALTSQSEAARQTGIPQQTISRYMAEMQPEVNTLVAQRRAAIMAHMLAGVEAGSEAVRKGLEAVRDGDTITNARELQAVATTVGIMQDKVNALHGGGTHRFGNADLTAGWSQHDRLILERIERVTLEPAEGKG